MGVDVAACLARLNAALPQYSDRWATLADLHQRKLWHQLTLQLQEVVKLPEFSQPSNDSLIDLYRNFIVDFSKSLSELAFVGIVIQVSKQFSFGEAINFLTEVSNSLKLETAKTVANMAIAELHLKEQRLTTTREFLDSAHKFLESMSSVQAETHASYFRVSADYSKVTGDHAAYYQDALKYLGCIELSQLPAQEQQRRAVDLALSALLAENLYNFGELLAHPILQVLSGTSDAWLRDLLFTFNRGDIATFEGQRSVWSQNEDLRHADACLAEKLRLMSLVELAFQRSSTARLIAFADIATTLAIAVEQVELLVMKSFSLNLLRGIIDEVNQAVQVSWVHPRVLDLAQVSVIKNRLIEWSKTVDATVLFVQQRTAELQ